MNGIEEIEKTCEHIKKPTIGIHETFLFDLQNRTIHYLGGGGKDQWEELIKIKPSLIYLNLDNKDEMTWLFDILHVNPLIHAECSEWSFKEKDYVMDFDDYFFICMSDLSEKDELENPIQMKIIVFKDFIIVVSCQELYFVNYLFYDFQSKHYRDNERFKTTGFQRALTLRKFRIEMHRKIDFEGILTVYDLFYQILKINIARFESLVMKLVIESKNCMDFSYEISYKELSDYQIRMSKAERELIYLMGIIKPKKKIIKTLLNLFSETRFYLVYLNGLSNRLKKIVSSLISSKNTLKAAKVLYHTCADDTLSRTGISSGEIMKFFAGMTTIFMPIASIESMWGQNMKVPGKDITDLRISAVFFSCFTIWIFFSVLYFKRIRWF